MEQSEWEKLSYNEKNKELFLRQCKLLKQYLSTGAISQAQFDKSYNDLIEKTGYKDESCPD